MLFVCVPEIRWKNRETIRVLHGRNLRKKRVQNGWQGGRKRLLVYEKALRTEITEQLSVCVCLACHACKHFSFLPLSLGDVSPPVASLSSPAFYSTIGSFRRPPARFLHEFLKESRRPP